MARQLLFEYRDPLDLIWLRAASRLGWRVERSGEVYASWDGRGTLTISEAAGFDPDDSVAQLIFHEICHALVEAPEGLGRVDWGLENIDDRDVLREFACHRLQASLAQEHGLRSFFAVTTDWRWYYDGLPTDPLAEGPDPAIPIAQAARRRAEGPPWWSALQEALGATAAVAQALGGELPAGSLWTQVVRAPPAAGG
jgi:hypothetical protein